MAFLGFTRELYTVQFSQESNHEFMFKAIGTIIVLYVVTNLFADATTAFESALVATFGTIEHAANVSSEELTTHRH